MHPLILALEVSRDLPFLDLQYHFVMERTADMQKLTKRLSFVWGDLHF